MANRRQFLFAAGATGLFAGLRPALAGPIGRAVADTLPERAVPPFGPPIPDPLRILDLPEGFSYRILATAGDAMDDGLVVPGRPDGMGAFDVGRGRLALVCNHELDQRDQEKGPFGSAGERVDRIDFAKVYDRGRDLPSVGGTTTLIYQQKSGRKRRHFQSLAGTERNCAGGPTPWGSWLTCEETTATAGGPRLEDHGWVFEVPAGARRLVAAKPLTALGRFNHEAAAVDPESGVVFLTEDARDGLFYRLVPEKPGELSRGGRLQALALRDFGGSADTRNWPRTGAPQLPLGQPVTVGWVDLEDTHAPDDDLRHRGRAAGAAVFARGEGIWFGNREVYFACTTGGAVGAGQIFRYRPSPYEGDEREREAPGKLELFVESTDRRLLDNCDNLTVSPWGDLIVCEDASTPCSLVGVTPDGRLYRFAENAYTRSELAGVCFAPNGRTLFVNVQARGLTLAIDGPFPGVGAM